MKDLIDIETLVRQHPRSDVNKRAEIADSLPFFLRAWWLRDRSEYADLYFGEGYFATMPMWCMHTDPFCDAGNSDSYQL
ncbi:MAG TPA: hypothetical protein V6C76_14420 [Drouetiella sp.]